MLNLIIPGQNTPPPPPRTGEQTGYNGGFVDVVRVDPFDLAPVKAALSPFLAKIDGFAESADAIKVMDDASQTTAVEMAGQVKHLGKSIEKARTDFVALPNDFVKQVNGLAKGILAKLEGIERGLKAKLGDYAHRQEMERRKAEEAARKATEEAQAKINAEAKAHNVEPVQIEVPVIPVKTEPVRTAAGTASTKTIWKFEVTHPNNIPREFLVVDEGAIRRAVGAGVRKIEGVRIYEEKEIAIRA